MTKLCLLNLQSTSKLVGHIKQVTTQDTHTHNIIQLSMEGGGDGNKLDTLRKLYHG